MTQLELEQKPVVIYTIGRREIHIPITIYRSIVDTARIQAEHKRYLHSSNRLFHLDIKEFRQRGVLSWAQNDGQLEHTE